MQGFPSVFSATFETQLCTNFVILLFLFHLIENDDQYNWYTYDMKEADDINEVCAVVNQLEGEYSYIYDEEASGTWYERNSKGQITNGDEGLTMPDLSAGLIAVIVAVCVIVVGGAACLCRSKKNKSSDSTEPVYQGGTML